MRWIPDWILYLLALGVVLWVLFSGPDHDAPPPPPEAIRAEGAMLPPASILDDRIIVQVNSPKDGVGTAFAINQSGQWLTARHVVDGCTSVALLVGQNAYSPAREVTISEVSDLALLETNIDTYPVKLDTGTDLRIGAPGFHIGYPQGRPGEVASRLMARSKLISRGERVGTEGVLAWAETGRTRGLYGSLAGLSGAPVFDRDGIVRGIVVAESPRRGRIYTAAPETISAFVDATGVVLSGEASQDFSPESYGTQADYARRNLQVVKIACDVAGR